MVMPVMVVARASERFIAALYWRAASGATPQDVRVSASGTAPQYLAALASAVEVAQER